MTTRTDSDERVWANPYVAGVLLGIVLFLAYFITGNGLGASGGIQRFVAWIADAVSPEHVDQNAYLARYAGGDTNPFSSYIIPMLIGVPIGAFVSAWRSKRLSATTGKGPNISVRGRWLLALVGGLLMGFGARLARGCTSGIALSGGAVLSVGAWAFMIAFFAGGYAFAYFVRREWN